MNVTSAFSSGKIILSGEYAVVFGFPGLAVPSSLGLHVSLETSQAGKPLTVQWEREPTNEWQLYAKEIVRRIQKQRSPLFGTVTISHDLPLGKGMGASTALLIALCRTIIGADCKGIARHLEDSLNRGHSGIDFTTIWEGKPTLYRKGAPPQAVDYPLSYLKDAFLIDTGLPGEPTPELVAWVRQREEDCRSALNAIGSCTERLLAGEESYRVIRDHHRAQVSLGVVPKKVQGLIAAIERNGGAAKVIGAGGKTRGAGMVLALGKNLERVVSPYQTLQLRYD